MQAAQIDPSKIYAIRINQKICRFRVNAVESRMFRRKLKPSAADYEHKIHGTLDARDFEPNELPADDKARSAFLTRTFEPAALEGEYEQYTELVTKAKAEREQAEADRLAKVQASKELAELFYSLTGLTKTATRHYSPFSFNEYSGGVGISNEGIAALLPLISQLKPADK